MTTWLIGVCISALGAALHAGLYSDKLFYHESTRSYEKDKRVLNEDAVGGYIIVALVSSLARPLVLVGAMIAAPLYGAFLLGKKLSAHKVKNNS